MSSKTPNVDLYKADKAADADQTFNIDTLLNENWEKVDAAIGEMRTEIGEIEPEIPDASTMQKGIVQLDDTTNSTSKGKAATADAVRRAKDEAIWAAVGVKDTRNVNAAPNTYIQGVTREFKIGASIGLDGQTHVLLETYKPWVDVSGGVIHQIGFGGTTGTLYRRTGTNDGTGWNGWVEQIHSGYSWQKHKLSEQNGASINVSGQDLNNLVATGFYDGQSLGNAPINSISEWWYIQVQRHSNSDQYVIQTARTLSSNSGLLNTYYQRIRTNGVWQAWTQDLFQSVANGKASLKTAISGKGGTFSQAGSTPTFEELVAGVNTLSGSSIARYQSAVWSEGNSQYLANGSAYPSVQKDLIPIPYGVRARLICQRTSSWSDNLNNPANSNPVSIAYSTSVYSYGDVNNSTTNGPNVQLYFILRDLQGNRMDLAGLSNNASYGGYSYVWIEELYIDYTNRKVYMTYNYSYSGRNGYQTGGSSPRVSIDMPATFNTSKGIVYLGINKTIYNNTSGGYSTYSGMGANVSGELIVEKI